MSQCTECRILQSNPLRADVPDHMKSFVVRDKLFGLKYIIGYECRKCQSLWRWHAEQSWVFIAAPKTRVVATDKRRAASAPMAVKQTDPETQAVA